MKYTIFNPLRLRCDRLLKRLNMSIALLMLAGPVFAQQVTVDIAPGHSTNNFNSGGAFTGLMHHSPSPNQTLTYGSSVDSWHDPKGIATDDGEQPGFDLVYKSGLTQSLPMTVPVAMLYDNPDNAANEMAYIEAHGYAINYVEMGEEPDGQSEGRRGVICAVGGRDPQS
jgi:hypothetical protein